LLDARKSSLLLMPLDHRLNSPKVVIFLVDEGGCGELEAI
jgi:hypothetical protein